jgi:hypothetical protein
LLDLPQPDRLRRDLDRLVVGMNSSACSSESGRFGYQFVKPKLPLISLSR